MAEPKDSPSASGRQVRAQGRGEPLGAAVRAPVAAAVADSSGLPGSSSSSRCSASGRTCRSRCTSALLAAFGAAALAALILPRACACPPARRRSGASSASPASRTGRPPPTRTRHRQRRRSAHVRHLAGAPRAARRHALAPARRQSASARRPRRPDRAARACSSAIFAVAALVGDAPTTARLRLPLQVDAALTTARLDAWVTPPSYTGRPP